MAAQRPGGSRLLAGALVVVMLQACAPTPSVSTRPDLSAVPPTSPVVGVVVSVTSTGLTSVTGFTLRTTDGTLYRFEVGALENGAEFPPGHLAEHQAAAEPVRVTFVLRGGVVVATRIEDAAVPAAT